MDKNRSARSDVERWTERDLVDAVLAAPDDDAPRLVLADWLLERGDARGELIAVQCALERCRRAGDFTTDAYRSALVKDAALQRSGALDDLIASHALGDLPVVCQRGFVEEVTIPVSRLDELWPHLSRLPLRAVRFTREEPLTLGVLRRLADRAFPRSLAAIMVESENAGAARLCFPAVIAAMATIGAPDDVEIWPYANALPIAPLDECIEALHAYRPFPRLPPSVRDLVVECYEIPSASELGVSDATQLETFELRATTDSFAAQVLGSWSFAHLRRLALGGPSAVFSNRRLGATTRSALAASSAMRSLRALTVDFAVDEAFVDALPAARLFTRPLVDFAARGKDREIFRVLCDRVPATMSTVELVDVPIDVETARALAECRRLERLAVLGFYPYPDAAVAAILQASPILASIPWLIDSSSARGEYADHDVPWQGIEGRRPWTERSGSQSASEASESASAQQRKPVE